MTVDLELTAPSWGGFGPNFMLRIVVMKVADSILTRVFGS